MSSLKIQFVVEEDLYPDLYRALIKISKNRLRAERLRGLANLGLHLGEGAQLYGPLTHSVSTANKATGERVGFSPQAVDSNAVSDLTVAMDGGEVKNLQHPVAPANKTDSGEVGFEPQVVDGKELSSSIVAMKPAEVKKDVAHPQGPQEHPGKRLAMQMALRGEFGARSTPKPAEK